MMKKLERVEKLELIQRSLGLRHKLKVHESMKPPENHEDLALMLIAKWEFQDELQAIEELLADSRLDNVREKKSRLASDYDLGGESSKEAPKKKPRK